MRASTMLNIVGSFLAFGFILMMWMLPLVAEILDLRLDPHKNPGWYSIPFIFTSVVILGVLFGFTVWAFSRACDERIKEKKEDG